MAFRIFVFLFIFMESGFALDSKENASETKNYITDYVSQAICEQKGLKAEICYFIGVNYDMFIAYNLVARAIDMDYNIPADSPDIARNIYKEICYTLERLSDADLAVINGLNLYSHYLYSSGEFLFFDSDIRAMLKNDCEALKKMEQEKAKNPKRDSNNKQSMSADSRAFALWLDSKDSIESNFKNVDFIESKRLDSVDSINSVSLTNNMLENIESRFYKNTESNNLDSKKLVKLESIIALSREKNFIESKGLDSKDSIIFAFNDLSPTHHPIYGIESKIDSNLIPTHYNNFIESKVTNIIALRRKNV
ncbi:hypothetical protein DCO58_03570 [Helicobacter saguini]|uniref:Uncharacterized protein n=1 Tax=Helicobacter saguini TaxID=1548018 RepID=A0A347VSD2_9HELI|nr:hypothetical protein [Helicobacter saguini]MWV62554.1 hypothetical protein [Helicobacter saguini]MWV66772.1 hypothetical protein [Helicobacter saguini]MWV69123.1 hypothetical protein [Helicobacter saguini]MWV71322.1 hypothetical protein [Helicobacter saguini]TLD94168.1 hypothetical protein LS64_006590 [Helicobacter saguini]